ncbi:MAG TPA: DUF3971 domain-containing protein, partial [Beijerinckiaceae bacterium]|nr:DUF3971 domain-containing protein [Beijerinckiaceae bacterium]
MVDQPHDMRNRIGPVAAQIRRRRAEDPLDLALRRLGGRSSIGPIKRCTIIGLTALTTIIVVAAVAVALFAARLTQGPISISDLGPRIAAALDQKVGPGYSFSVGATSITGSLRGLALSIDGLALRDMTGRPLVVAPKAEVSLDPLALLRGNVMPKRLQILDVDVRLSVLPDGSMAVSAGSDPILLPATPVSTSGAAATADVSQLASAAPQSAVQPVADAVSHVLDVVTAPDSPLSALERVGIAHGSLVFDDRTLNETTTYSNFELTYRKADDKLDFKVAADGASGRWQIGAKAQGAVGSGRSVDFNLDNVSLDQIVLFGGVRNLGFDFDMPISTKLHFGIDSAGHLAQAGGQFSFGSGYFYTSNPDAEPMLVDSLVGGFHWDAVNQQIVIDPTQFSSGKSHFEINSTLTAPQDGSDGWRVEAETSPGGVVGPERPGETPVAVDAHVAGRLFVAERRFAVERFALSGPQVDFSMSGTLAWGSEAQTHIKLAATAGKMPMRAVVRLWPSFISAPVHAWFLQHLLDGTLDKGAIAVDFSGADLTAMREHLPIPAESVNLDFSLANASTSFLPGVPPLSNLTGNGHVTGRTVDFAATGGVLDDGGGRILTLADGTFHVADTSLKPTPTVIKAHVLGGLDAVADFLSHDALKSVGTTMPIDTATVKGQVDAQLAIDLKIDKVVLPADISIGARATVNDFSVDKIIAKEKLDQAVLNVVFDNSVLHAQGSGRLFGAPASIELTKPASGSTVAEVSARLDDAARARLGWSLGPALVGSIGAHFVSALGQGDTVHSQVDLDLTHADIENLLPGYVKPAGRPAKVSFGVTTDGQGIVLDPVVFDGGTSSARGS